MRRRAPGTDACTAEHGGAQNGRGEKQRGEDRREGPVVADAAQEEIRLEAVIAPPEAGRVGSAAPEPRRVVELEEPPAAERCDRDEAAFDTVGRAGRPAGEAGRPRGHEEDVAGPDEPRAPARGRREGGNEGRLRDPGD